MTPWRFVPVIALASACGPDEAPAPPTELVVVVDTDMPVPDALDAVDLYLSAANAPSEMSTTSLAVAGTLALPIVRALASRGDAPAAVVVAAVGRRGGAVVVRREARTAFTPHESRTLRIVLQRSCAGVACARDTTCSDGQCWPVEVPSDSLPPWTGQAPASRPSSLDASLADASTDATPPRDATSMPDAITPPDAAAEVATEAAVEADVPRDASTASCSCPPRPGATAACGDAGCSYLCDPGFADCDSSTSNGCETGTASDWANCGACRRVCTFANASATCTLGVCALGACTPGFADCDGDRADGCETDTRTSLSHCGGCGRACTTACAAGVCRTAVCVDGAMRCYNGRIEQCRLGAYETVSECPSGSCSGSSTCRPQICTPGSFRCNGESSQECNSSGTAWTSYEDCPALGRRCVGGRCV